ncbi:sulfotransferase domain-containing protein [Spirulina subsalsa FACHB-351]|uniref:Sulfotransferase domain-containing protein n=1 Tax=Spirulina subsalsa FACHB-351 TaxID=234711 RepID=A0ABT3L1G1_9CYAN|nr:sulfotransferase domain-containing protein [Spirulina subsalsa]MCW6034870.1 sulfotransferase domain-containing protein [Spirulina subsalsa FACHB-351]
MTTPTQKPNFFIVGAPKCGTTAMHSYLEQHPEIFMLNIPDSPDNLAGGKREIHFFGSDLNFSRPTLEEYLSYFNETKDEKIRGESSVFYLYFKRAAQEIKQFNAEAKILIMLRNPLEMMYSWHSQLVFWGDENIADFATALKAEATRQKGMGIPEKRDHPVECFFYSKIACYTEQVKRYLDIFGRENVEIIIFDDFKQDTLAVYRKTLQFLGCRDDFAADFKVVNANRQVRNIAVQQFLRRPPKSLRSVVRFLIPSRIRKSLRGSLEQYNVEQKSRSPLNPELKERLQREFRPEIEQLSELLHRDLSHWVGVGGNH